MIFKTVTAISLNRTGVGTALKCQRPFTLAVDVHRTKRVASGQHQDDADRKVLHFLANPARRAAKPAPLSNPRRMP